MGRAYKLLKAAKIGDINIVKRVLDDDSGCLLYTDIAEAYEEAIKHNQTVVVKFIQERGDFKQVWSSAISAGNVSVLHIAITNKLIDPKEAFYLSSNAWKNHQDLFNYFMKEGHAPDLDYNKVLSNSMRHFSLPFVKYSLQKGAGTKSMTRYHMADPEILEELLKYGGDPTIPLMSHIGVGGVSIVKLLLEYGAIVSENHIIAAKSKLKDAIKYGDYIENYTAILSLLESHSTKKIL